MRNSWGTKFGEAGHIRVQYGSNLCKINSEPTKVVVEPLGGDVSCSDAQCCETEATCSAEFVCGDGFVNVNLGSACGAAECEHTHAQLSLLVALQALHQLLLPNPQD